MIMKVEQVGLSGFGNILNDIKPCKFGELKIDDILPEASLAFDKKRKSIVIIDHPILGSVPHYKGVIYDVCIKCYELLIKRMEE